MLSSPSEGKQRDDDDRASATVGFKIRVAHISEAKQDKHDCEALKTHKRLEGVLAHQRRRVEEDVEVDCLTVKQLFSCTRYLIILNKKKKSFVLFCCGLVIPPSS